MWKGEEVLPQVSLLEHLLSARSQSLATELTGEVSLAFHERDRYGTTGQQIGEQCPRGTATDDDHVAVHSRMISRPLTKSCSSAAWPAHEVRRLEGSRPGTRADQGAGYGEFQRHATTAGLGQIRGRQLVDRHRRCGDGPRLTARTDDDGLLREAVEQDLQPARTGGRENVRRIGSSKACRSSCNLSRNGTNVKRPAGLLLNCPLDGEAYVTTTWWP